MRKFITHRDRIVPVHLPRVLVETAVTHGAPRDALFENSDLTPDMLTSPDMRVSYLQYSMLAANALRLTGEPALGVHVGLNTGIPQMGVLGFVLMSSSTVGDALAATLRYQSAFFPGWQITLTREGVIATLTIREALPMEPFQVFATEVVAGAVFTQARFLSGGELPIRRVVLPFAEPPHSAAYAKHFPGVPISYDATDGAIIDFDAAILDAPIAFADPATARLAEHYCAELAASEAPSEGLVSQVKRLLMNAIGAPPDLSWMARKLQTSTRSLRRELRELGTSYHELLDESRRVRAEQWMQTSSMPIEQLATQLGFTHVRSFRRAYKRWTGRTPSASRARGPSASEAPPE